MVDFRSRIAVVLAAGMAAVLTVAAIQFQNKPDAQERRAAGTPGDPSRQDSRRPGKWEPQSGVSGPPSLLGQDTQAGTGSAAPAADTNGPSSGQAPGEGSSFRTPSKASLPDLVESKVPASLPGVSGRSHQPQVTQSAIEYDVPLGARLPAVFVDEEPMTEAQNRTADQMVREFIAAAFTEDQKVIPDVVGKKGDSSTSAGSAPRTGESNNWINSLRLADEHYRALFGQDAYNAHSVRSAIEALAEKP